MSQAKVAVITGATRGIGEAIARFLFTQGFHLILTGRSAEDLRRIRAELDDGGERIYLVGGDICSRAIQERVVLTAMGLGRVDLLVLNAGIEEVGTLSLSPESLRRLFEVNYFSAIELTRLLLPLMEEQKGGLIVPVSSVAATIPFQGSGAYGGSKAAMELSFFSLAREVAPLGIKVTVLRPHWVDTGMADRLECALASERRISPTDLVQVLSMLLKLGPQTTIPVVEVRCLDVLDVG